ncbi:hypothetical protein [Thermosipho ferrireducens]|nr:hypothetical protein [Thermosipho ferrireducens]
MDEKIKNNVPQESQSEELEFILEVEELETRDMPSVVLLCTYEY